MPKGNGPYADAPLSKAEYVVERIRWGIADGTYMPGFQLRQLDIAESFGVSQTPVREALALLASQGLVAYSRHKGVTVIGLTSTERNDLYALRSATEGLAAQLAAGRLSAEAIDRLSHMNDTLREHRISWSAERLSSLSRDLHLGIYQASSPVVAKHIDHILNITPPYDQIWSDEAEAERLIDEHVLILEALRNKDGVTARELMERHIMGSAEYYETSLPQQSAEPEGEASH